MTISHWGIFPGYFVPGPMTVDGYVSAVWKPMPWDAWCAMSYAFELA